MLTEVPHSSVSEFNGRYQLIPNSIVHLADMLLNRLIFITRSAFKVKLILLNVYTAPKLRISRTEPCNRIAKCHQRWERLAEPAPPPGGQATRGDRSCLTASALVASSHPVLPARRDLLPLAVQPCGCDRQGWRSAPALCAARAARFLHARWEAQETTGLPQGTALSPLPFEPMIKSKVAGFFSLVSATK